MLFYKEITSEWILGVWKIEESRDDLLSSLSEFGNLADTISLKLESRIIERLATRVLLKNLLGEEKIISYYPTGKPYLMDKSYEISISHTEGYVAVLLSASKSVGIDIEYFSDRIKRIRSKFIGESEYIDPENDVIHLLLHWTAKEALYKMLGQSGIDLRKDLQISKFIPACKGVFLAQETVTNQHQLIKINYATTDFFVLAFIVN